MGFGENLKERLEYVGLKQTDLARKTSIKLRSIQKYVQKDGSKPSADNAVKIAQVLGVTVEYLVTGKNCSENNYSSLEPELQKLIRSIRNLPKDKQKMVTKIALYLTGVL
ncbi:MAG: helix-turn-helix domain-containing protein [Spirochaetes bacterium]|nr:helix-turn-helix domain-containing protein [Spirochaetota bacterium]